jgi:dTDP-4-dehydrorhamnose 3,5-epimerase
MDVQALAIPDVKLITPKVHRDARGLFCETYRADALTRAGVDITFVQDNYSLSTQKGVVRGLHFQTAPHAQDKLVRVIRGSILDVAVDLRRSSPTYGKHVSAVLSADNWAQLLVPVGFAHAFLTLEPNTEVAYKVSAYYAPECDKGLRWNDPALGIAWPIDPADAILSEKDQNLPLLKDLAAYF